MSFLRNRTLHSSSGGLSVGGTSLTDNTLNHGDTNPRRRSSRPIVVGVSRSWGNVPASITHFPDGAVILVTGIDCRVSTPLAAVQPCVRAHPMYSAKVG
jgi:hypothetical protein